MLSSQETKILAFQRTTEANNVTEHHFDKNCALKQVFNGHFHWHIFGHYLQVVIINMLFAKGINEGVILWSVQRSTSQLPCSWASYQICKIVGCACTGNVECRERFPRHRLLRKSLVSDPGKCVMHVPWCMSGSLTHGGGENVPGIPGACTTRNIMYLARGPWYR